LTSVKNLKLISFIIHSRNRRAMIFSRV